MEKLEQAVTKIKDSAFLQVIEIINDLSKNGVINECDLLPDEFTLNGELDRVKISFRWRVDSNVFKQRIVSRIDYRISIKNQTWTSGHIDNTMPDKIKLLLGTTESIRKAYRDGNKFDVSEWIKHRNYRKI